MELDTCITVYLRDGPRAIWGVLTAIDDLGLTLAGMNAGDARERNYIPWSAVRFIKYRAPSEKADDPQP